MPYNGYTEKERRPKGDARARLLRNGTIRERPSDCMLCGDPEATVEGHSEDYSQPYLWEPPALYWLCRHCHRDKLHKRFFNPKLWKAYLAHVRRGGYARELSDATIAREFTQFRVALKEGKPATLRPLRDRPDLAACEWWDHLTIDRASLNDPAARLRS